MGDGVLPFEIGLEKAKRETLQAINHIGNSYSIPSSIMLMLVEQIVEESKLNTYTTIITNYDISIPQGAIPQNPLENDDVEMKADDV